ncbi:hypothetical protein [Streptomyces sp. NPDC006463]|uniref:hypothetical protein n=1 Tax=Streptomyces sp. NPDC006463 TaxID=3364746 RepID=UPI0036C9A6FE
MTVLALGTGRSRSSPCGSRSGARQFLYGEIDLLVTGSARKAGTEVSHAACASGPATIRRVFVGSRDRFEDMVLALAARELRPQTGRVHSFEEVHAAYRGYVTDPPFGEVAGTARSRRAGA